jgi:Coenzyme PQQ synthesis protein D (PqqD)
MTDQGDQACVPASSKPAQPQMSGRSVRARPSGLAWRQAGDEVVVLDLVAGSYHAFNAAGAFLWERLADWTTAGELARVLVSFYGLTPAAAALDVVSFLDGCADAGLLEIAES